MTVRVYRTHVYNRGLFAGRTKTFVPHKDRSGNYVLGPRPRRDQHHAVAKVTTPDLAEVVRLLRAGRHCLRMRGELTGQVNMIVPDRITIEER